MACDVIAAKKSALVGAVIGKASAVVKISSQSAASRSKHLRDVDALARLLGPPDRADARLSKGERKLLGRVVGLPRITQLGVASIRALIG